MSKETLKISDRFELSKKLGQGTFSYIYEAYDKKEQMKTALKVEKRDKNKDILMFEYNVLLNLKGLQHVPRVYDFVKNSEQNLIVMDLLGINLAKVRRCLETNYSLKIAILMVVEMLAAVKEVHERGFIHRDVKASNFVLDQNNRNVYIVDFGLAKKHLDANHNPVARRRKADFRGTVSFASLNAHNNIDLSRRDDIWSLYFTLLDFLNEKLEWREQRDYTIHQVKDIKTKCLDNPKKRLWIGPTKNIAEIEAIFNHINELDYESKPNYDFIKAQIMDIYNNYDMIQRQVGNVPNSIKWEVRKRPHPLFNTFESLQKYMRENVQKEFQDFFRKETKPPTGGHGNKYISLINNVNKHDALPVGPEDNKRESLVGGALSRMQKVYPQQAAMANNILPQFQPPQRLQGQQVLHGQPQQTQLFSQFDMQALNRLNYNPQNMVYQQQGAEKAQSFQKDQQLQQNIQAGNQHHFFPNIAAYPQTINQDPFFGQMDLQKNNPALNAQLMGYNELNRPDFIFPISKMNFHLQGQNANLVTDAQGNAHLINPETGQQITTSQQQFPGDPLPGQKPANMVFHHGDWVNQDNLQNPQVQKIPSEDAKLHQNSLLGKKKASNQSLELLANQIMSDKIVAENIESPKTGVSQDRKAAGPPQKSQQFENPYMAPMMKRQKTDGEVASLATQLQHQQQSQPPQLPGSLANQNFIYAPQYIIVGSDPHPKGNPMVQQQAAQVVKPPEKPTSVEYRSKAQQKFYEEKAQQQLKGAATNGKKKQLPINPNYYCYDPVRFEQAKTNIFQVNKIIRHQGKESSLNSVAP